MKKIELRVSHDNAVHMTYFTSLVEVVSGALGGKKNAKPEYTEDLSKATAEHFATRINSLMSI